MEVLVVDNHSTDDTEAVVRALAPGYPVELRYVYEPVHGKYAAMNTAVTAARGAIIAATDDDAVVDPEWLESADRALVSLECDFVGGPVTPLWQQASPPWLDLSTPSIQRVLALLDYGTAVREFGVGIGSPLGSTSPTAGRPSRRQASSNPSLGRSGTLRSQAQREWHLRARAAGCRGFYVPDMRVQHRVEPRASRAPVFPALALLARHQPCPPLLSLRVRSREPERRGTTARSLPFFGVPRRLFPKALTSLRSCIWRRLRGQKARAFEYQLWLCFFAGLARQCHPRVV